MFLLVSPECHARTLRRQRGIAQAGNRRASAIKRGVGRPDLSWWTRYAFERARLRALRELGIRDSF